MDLEQFLSLAISIHTLHTEGDSVHFKASIKELTISIHTLHTEGDLALLSLLRDSIISIHTLHTEGDSKKKRYNRLLPFYFNPHPPHGG